MVDWFKICESMDYPLYSCNETHELLENSSVWLDHVVNAIVCIYITSFLNTFYISDTSI